MQIALLLKDVKFNAEDFKNVNIYFTSGEQY